MADMNQIYKAMEIVRNPPVEFVLNLSDELVAQRNERVYNAACESLAHWLITNAAGLMEARPLGEWERVKPWVNSDRQEWRLKTPFGFCRVREDNMGNFSCNGSGGVVIGQCDSVTDGKMKAEAWYRDCLTAVLKPVFGK